MYKKDLSLNEIQFLKECRDNASYQYSGIERTVMNTLTSYGLVEYCGNSKYCITNKGRELLQEDDDIVEEQSEEISNIPF